MTGPLPPPLAELHLYVGALIGLLTGPSFPRNQPQRGMILPYVFNMVDMGNVSIFKY